MPLDKLQGSCLCQKVCYEINGPIIALNLCHCTMCQKSHGSAFGPYLRVKKSDFNFSAGIENVKHYSNSSGIRRTFCSECGSSLQWIRESSVALGVAAGTLDTDIDMEPTAQYWCEDSKGWHQLRDDVPRFNQEN